jgi:putative protein-disulfide isomerase
MKFIFLILFSMGIYSSSFSQEKPVLIYIGDPMCSWCYGFSPEFSATVEALGDKVDLRIIMGGLRPYNTQTMADLELFLKGHWEEVALASGQTFSYDILKNDEITYDTEPPSRAVLIIRKLQPEAEFDFFKSVQKAFYYDNRNMHEVETYLELTDKYGINPTEFKQLFKSEEIKEEIKLDFKNSDDLGVRGFPTVLLIVGEKIHRISNGYMKSNQLLERIEKIMKP